MKDLGYDRKKYGLHSLRSRGATAVMSNNVSQAVSQRFLKLHGRWKIDEAKDLYVLETECNRLRVTVFSSYLNMSVFCFSFIMDIGKNTFH